MYKISEFSKITNLTVKALRYYDEQGILIPSARSESDYRLYDESDGISTVHIGDYQKLNGAYKAVLDYAKEKGIECVVPSMEVYQKGPGMIFKGNPDKYVTEVIVPFKEAK